MTTGAFHAVLLVSNVLTTASAGIDDGVRWAAKLHDHDDRVGKVQKQTCTK